MYTIYRSEHISILPSWKSRWQDPTLKKDKLLNLVKAGTSDLCVSKKSTSMWPMGLHFCKRVVYKGGENFWRIKVCGGRWNIQIIEIPFLDPTSEVLMFFRAKLFFVCDLTDNDFWLAECRIFCTTLWRMGHTDGISEFHIFLKCSAQHSCELWWNTDMWWDHHFF